VFLLAEMSMIGMHCLNNLSVTFAVFIQESY